MKKKKEKCKTHSSAKQEDILNHPHHTYMAVENYAPKEPLNTYKYHITNQTENTPCKTKGRSSIHIPTTGVIKAKMWESGKTKR